MGRRKIEIQPITHERNRSVTFLKRKNGLFKKAYELGVLCSVEVAVIIFEDRPGHQQKLYQYSSSDIYDIVQRHIRHDGEKDTRTLADFSNASGKADDNADGYEDDIDDEDEPPSSSINHGVKRRGDGKEKLNDLHRPMAIPPPPIPSYSRQSINGASSSLPISGERMSSGQRGVGTAGGSPSPKKARINSSLGITRSSSDETGYAAYHQANVRHGAQNTSLGYNGLYPGSQNPNAGFVSNGFDFSQASSSRVNGSYPPAANAPPSYRHQHTDHNDTGNFHHHQHHQPPLMRHPSNRQQQQQHPAASSVDLFAALQREQSFGALEWPVHSAPTSQPPSQPPPNAGPSQHAISQNASTQQHTNNPQETPPNWLSFISPNDNNVPPSGTTNPNPLASNHTPNSNPRDGPLPWERSQDTAEMFAINAAGPTTTNNNNASVGRRAGSANSQVSGNRSGMGSGATSGLEDEGTGPGNGSGTRPGTAMSVKTEG